MKHPSIIQTHEQLPIWERALALFIALQLFLSPLYAQTPAGWAGLNKRERTIAMQYMGRASLQGSAREWLREQDAMFSVLRGLWQREELDQRERGEREATVRRFSLENYGRWAVDYFLRDRPRSQVFSDFLNSRDDRYILRRGGDGEYLKDSEGKYVLRGLDSLAQDEASFAQEAKEKRDELLARFDALESDFVRFGGELELSGEEVAKGLQREWQTRRTQLERGLENQYQYARSRFLQLRSYDSASRRRESEKERAGTVVGGLLDGFSDELESGLAALRAKAQEIGAGGQETGLDADRWQEEFRRLYERGRSHWEKAGEALYQRRLDWEQSARENLDDGEAEWASARKELERREQEWKEELDETLRSGKELWGERRAELKVHLEKLNQEYLQDQGQREASYKEVLNNILTLYAQHQNALQNARKSKKFWAQRYYANRMREDPDDDGSLVKLSALGQKYQKSFLRENLDTGKHEYAPHEQLLFWEKMIGSSQERLLSLSEKLRASYGFLLRNRDAEDPGEDGDPESLLGAVGEQGGASAEGLSGLDELAKGRYLSRYQLTLLKAKLLKKYWERELEVRDAVLGYARDLSSGRERGEESLRAYEEAKEEFERAQGDYAAKMEELTGAAAKLDGKSSEINQAIEALNNTEAKIAELQEVLDRAQIKMKMNEPLLFENALRNAYESLERLRTEFREMKGSAEIQRELRWLAQIRRVKERERELVEGKTDSIAGKRITVIRSQSALKKAEQDFRANKAFLRSWVEGLSDQDKAALGGGLSDEAAARGVLEGLWAGSGLSEEEQQYYTPVVKRHVGKNSEYLLEMIGQEWESLRIQRANAVRKRADTIELLQSSDLKTWLESRLSKDNELGELFEGKLGKPLAEATPGEILEAGESLKEDLELYRLKQRKAREVELLTQAMALLDKRRGQKKAAPQAQGGGGTTVVSPTAWLSGLLNERLGTKNHAELERELGEWKKAWEEFEWHSDPGQIGEWIAALGSDLDKASVAKKLGRLHHGESFFDEGELRRWRSILSKESQSRLALLESLVQQFQEADSFALSIAGQELGRARTKERLKDLGLLDENGALLSLSRLKEAYALLTEDVRRGLMLELKDYERYGGGFVSLFRALQALGNYRSKSNKHEELAARKARWSELRSGLDRILGLEEPLAPGALGGLKILGNKLRQLREAETVQRDSGKELSGQALREQELRELAVLWELREQDTRLREHVDWKGVTEQKLGAMLARFQAEGGTWDGFRNQVLLRLDLREGSRGFRLFGGEAGDEWEQSRIEAFADEYRQAQEHRREDLKKKLTLRTNQDVDLSEFKDLSEESWQGLYYHVLAQAQASYDFSKLSKERHDWDTQWQSYIKGTAAEDIKGQLFKILADFINQEDNGLLRLALKSYQRSPELAGYVLSRILGPGGGGALNRAGALDPANGAANNPSVNNSGTGSGVDYMEFLKDFGVYLEQSEGVSLGGERVWEKLGASAGPVSGPSDALTRLIEGNRYLLAAELEQSLEGKGLLRYGESDWKGKVSQLEALGGDDPDVVERLRGIAKRLREQKRVKGLEVLSAKLRGEVLAERLHNTDRAKSVDWGGEFGEWLAGYRYSKDASGQKLGAADANFAGIYFALRETLFAKAQAEERELLRALLELNEELPESTARYREHLGDLFSKGKSLNLKNLGLLGMDTKPQKSYSEADFHSSVDRTNEVAALLELQRALEQTLEMAEGFPEGALEDESQYRAKEAELRAQLEEPRKVQSRIRNWEVQVSIHAEQLRDLVLAGETEEIAERLKALKNEISKLEAERNTEREEWGKAIAAYRVEQKRYEGLEKEVGEFERLRDAKELELRKREEIWHYASQEYLDGAEEVGGQSDMEWLPESEAAQRQARLRYSAAAGRYDALLAQGDQAALQRGPYKAVYEAYYQSAQRRLRQQRSRKVLGEAIAQQRQVVERAQQRIEENLEQNFIKEERPLIWDGNGFDNWAAQLLQAEGEAYQSLKRDAEVRPFFRRHNFADQLLYLVYQDARDSETAADKRTQALKNYWKDVLDSRLGEKIDISLKPKGSDSAYKARVLRREIRLKEITHKTLGPSDWQSLGVRFLPENLPQREIYMENIRNGVYAKPHELREAVKTGLDRGIEKGIQDFKDARALAGLSDARLYAALGDAGYKALLSAEEQQRVTAYQKFLSDQGVSVGLLQTLGRNPWDNYFYSGGSIAALAGNVEPGTEPEQTSIEVLSYEEAFYLADAYQKRYGALEVDEALQKTYASLGDVPKVKIGSKDAADQEKIAGLLRKYPELGTIRRRSFAAERQILLLRMHRIGLNEGNMRDFAYALWHESRGKSDESVFGAQDFRAPGMDEFLGESKTKVAEELRHLEIDLSVIFSLKSSQAWLRELSDKKIWNYEEEAGKAYERLKGNGELWSIYKLYRAHFLNRPGSLRGGSLSTENDNMVRSFMGEQVGSDYLGKTANFLDGYKVRHNTMSLVSLIAAHSFTTAAAVAAAASPFGWIAAIALGLLAVTASVHSVVEGIKAADLDEAVRQVENRYGEFSREYSDISRNTLERALSEGAKRQKFHEESLAKLKILEGRGAEDLSAGERMAESLLMALELRKLDLEQFYGASLSGGKKDFVLRMLGFSTAEDAGRADTADTADAASAGSGESGDAAGAFQGHQVQGESSMEVLLALLDAEESWFEASRDELKKQSVHLIEEQRQRDRSEEQTSAMVLHYMQQKQGELALLLRLEPFLLEPFLSAQSGAGALGGAIDWSELGKQLRGKISSLSAEEFRKLDVAVRHNFLKVLKIGEPARGLHTLAQKIEVAGERFERVMEGLIELQKLRREQSGGRVWEEQTHLRRLLHSDLDNYKAQGLGGSIYAKEEFGAMGRSAGAMGKMYQRRLALEGELHQARIGEAKADLEQRQRNWWAMMERVRSRGITAWARALERLEQKRSEWLGRMKDKSRSYAQSWEERRENLARRQQAWAEELLSRAQEAQHEALSGTAAFAGIAGAEGQNAVLRLPSFSGERLSAEGLIKELGQLPMLERLKGLNSGLELRGLPRYRRGVRAEAREFFKKFHDAQTAEREELGKKMLAILIVRTQELWAKLLGQLDQNVAKTNHSYAKRWQKVFGSQGWGYDAGGKNYHKQVLYSATMFNVDSRATQVSAYEYYQWRRDKELEHYILKQQESRFLRKRLQRGATALAGARILEALGKEIDKDELNALNRAGMRFYLGAQQGLLEKVGKAIFSEIAAEEVNWIAGKKKSDWGGGFALWTRDKEEAKLSGKARKKAKWAYYRALESDWESNGLFEKSGAGETGRLTRELLRYQMIHGFGNSQFGLSPKERDLWQAGEHDLIQPLRLGFIEQIAHSIIIAVGTMGIGTALSAVDAISKFGATALTTLAGTGMQVGASFVSSGSNLWGGADPYLEGQKLASALSKSVIAGGLGVLSAGAGEILGEGLVGKVLVDGGLAAGRSMIGGALSSAVLGEALDGKGLLLNAAFAGLGGGIASGLGQMEGLGSLGEDMLNSGVHFGLDTGKAALMALDGDGNFDDTQFLADWGGSFAGNGFSALGSLASYGISASMDSYKKENAPQQSNNWENIGKIGSIMELGGYVAKSAVRGAIIKQSQTLDGNIIGQLLGNTFLGIDAISREAQARGGNFGDFVKHTGEKVGNKVKQGWEWLKKSEVGQWFKAHAQNMKRHYKKRIEPVVDFVERNEIGVKQADVTFDEEGMPDSLDVKVGTPSALEKGNEALGKISDKINDNASIGLAVGEHVLKFGMKIDPKLTQNNTKNELTNALSLSMGVASFLMFSTGDQKLSSNLLADWSEILLFQNRSSGVNARSNLRPDLINFNVNWQASPLFRLNTNMNYDFNQSKFSFDFRGNYQDGRLYVTGGVGIDIQDNQVTPVLGFGAGINFPEIGSRLGIDGTLFWNPQNQEFTPRLDFEYNFAGIFSNY